MRNNNLKGIFFKQGRRFFTNTVEKSQLGDTGKISLSSGISSSTLHVLVKFIFFIRNI